MQDCTKSKGIDYSIFDKVPLDELINEQSFSDKESVHSLSEDFLSDEEMKNNYAFLESFKKPKRSKRKKKIPQPPVKEESYKSD